MFAVIKVEQNQNPFQLLAFLVTGVQYISQLSAVTGCAPGCALGTEQ